MLKKLNLTCYIIIIDVDFFKSFNDSYGHSLGDECLKNISKTISEELRIPHKSSNIYNYITISVGFTTITPLEKASYFKLIEMADKALYKVKEKGRNRVEGFDN